MGVGETVGIEGKEMAHVVLWLTCGGNHENLPWGCFCGCQDIDNCQTIRAIHPL